MTLTKKLSIGLLMAITAFVIFSLISKTLSENSPKVEARVMDSLESVPEWLKLNVDEAFPLNDLNIWVPSNNFQTSSLVKVPRFPRKYSDEELGKNEALRSFEIVSLTPNQLLKISGVRNEKISAQIAVGSVEDIKNLNIEFSNFENESGQSYINENIQTRYVQYLEVQRARSEYVWSPKLEEIVGEAVSGSMAPNIVADPLLDISEVDVPAYRAQPIWFTFNIPKDLNRGNYRGKITIKSGNFEDQEFQIELNISDYILPDYKNYKFHLDLLVNPSSIAELYNFDHWSEEHWKMIEVYLKDYASKGGKNIATTLYNEPWHKPWLQNTTRSQTAIGYKSMVNWTKGKDGKWKFDFTIFDRYVELAERLGIDESINAFSMTPFLTNQTIEYFDKNEGKMKNLEMSVYDDLYKEVWSQFLVSFEDHLRSKRLFERTFLGFDERPKKIMNVIYKLIDQHAPEFLEHIFISGHPEVGEKAQNLSISYMFFPDQKLEKRAVVPVTPTIQDRASKNRTTTFYLCAEPGHPNTLTYSPAVESRLIPWLALKHKTDGYLRWSYNNWTKDPFNKPVFIHSQGDDYYVYPGDEGPISSIRWELLNDGIEDFELFKLVQENSKISNDSLQIAIELATRNEDGRYKNIDDISKARNILIKKNVSHKLD